MKSLSLISLFPALAMASVNDSGKSSIESLQGDRTVPDVGVNDRAEWGETFDTELFGLSEEQFQLLQEAHKDVREKIAQSAGVTLDEKEELPKLKNEIAEKSQEEDTIQEKPLPKIKKAPSSTRSRVVKETPKKKPPEPQKYQSYVPKQAELFDGYVNVFAKSKRKKSVRTGYSLPAGSFVEATLEEGARVGLRPTEIALKLRGTWLGPNGARVTMNDCIAFVEFKANLQHGVVDGKSQDINCRSPKGHVFTVQMSGYITDYDREYRGVDGKLVLEGPLYASALSAAQETIKEYGKALSAVQKTVSAVASEKNTEKVSNVTGSENDYIKGKVIEESANFLSKIREHFEQREAFFAIEPGKKVFIRNRRTIYIPEHFFDGEVLNVNKK